jgi:hypothetical protein
MGDQGMHEAWSDGDQISDAELTELALAADPNPIFDRDAVPWNPADGEGVQLLPEWYMPMPRTRRKGSWPKATAAVVVVGFLLIGAWGLCITSGFLSWA